MFLHPHKYNCGIFLCSLFCLFLKELGTLRKTKQALSLIFRQPMGTGERGNRLKETKQQQATTSH